MTPMVDEAGNVWEVDEGGNPVRMIAPAAAPAQGRVFSLAPSPKEQRQEARADEDQQLQREANARAADNAARDAQNDSVANQLKAIEVELKRRELSGESPKDAKEGRARAGTLRALVNQINRTQTLFNSGPGATSGLGGALDYLPTNSNRQFDTAGASLSQQGLAAFRVPGTGTVSDRDAIMFDRANLPSASNLDAATQEQLRGLRARVEEEYRTLGLGTPAWEGLPGEEAQQKADNELPGVVNGADTKPPSPGEVKAVTDGKKTTFDPEVSALLDSMINAGAGAATINAALAKRGFQPVRDDELKAAQAWMKGNPGKKYYGGNAERTENLSFGQQILNNEYVAPFATGLANYFDAATAGTASALAGEEGQGNLKAASALNPGWAAGGNLLGAVTGAMGAEAAIGGRLAAAGVQNAAKWAPRLGDTLFGAATGFNSAQDGEGLQGALTGAGVGLLGGAVGRAAIRGVGGAARGVQNANAGYLQKQGVPLTVGSVVGGGIKKIEDALTGTPFVGSVVENRQREGIEAVANRMAEDAVKPIGGTVAAVEYGEPLVEDLLRQGSDAYTAATAGARVPQDAQYLSDIAAIRSKADLLPPDLGDRLRRAIENRVDPAFEQGPNPIRRLGDDGFGTQQMEYASPAGPIPFEVMPNRSGRGLEIGIDEANLSGANRLGVGGVREAAGHIRREFPNAEELFGKRISGANPGREQSVNISSIPATPLPAELTGENFQQAVRGLKSYRAEAAKPGFEQDYRDALSGGIDALRGQMTRGGGQKVVAQLGQADEAWKRIKIIQNAVKAARNGSRSGEVGLPMPSQFNDAAYKAADKFGGPRFNGELLDAAQQVLPSKLADSGTWTRALVGGGALGLPTALGGGVGASEGGLGGAGAGGVAGGLGGMLLLAVGGSKPAQKLLVSALTKRPAAFRVAGDRLVDQAAVGGRIGSGLGASVLTPLLVGP